MTRQHGDHDRPLGRPIHPECDLLVDRHAECSCAGAWSGWDGSPAGLQSAIKAARRQELRAIPQVLSGAALASATPLDSLLTSSDDGDEAHSDTFWSRAEFLLTIDRPGT